MRDRWRERKAEREALRQAKKTEMAKPSMQTKALSAASVAAPQIAPAVIAANKLEKYSLAKRASAKNKAARQAIVQKFGVRAIFKPRYWLLLISGITVKHPFVVFIVSVIAAILVLSYTFGGVTVVYGIYFVKCAVVFVPNVVLSGMNAIWFALHGTYFLIITAVFDITNGIFSWFLSPIYGFINWIAEKLSFGVVQDPVEFKGVGENFPISVQPHEGFGYLMPAPITVKYDSSNHMDLLGTLGTLFEYKWMKPGEQLYSDEKQYFYSENGAKLFTPKLNPNAIADGPWTSIGDSKTVFYIFDAGEMLTRWQAMLSVTTEPTEQPIYEPGNGEQWTPPEPPSANSIIGQVGGGILRGIMQLFYDWYIEPWAKIAWMNPHPGSPIVWGG
jgi:hypothetical protein